VPVFVVQPDLRFRSIAYCARQPTERTAILFECVLAEIGDVHICEILEGGAAADNRQSGQEGVIEDIRTGLARWVTPQALEA
jgi:hypothetical protein